jgi:hypothetical protein
VGWEERAGGEVAPGAAVEVGRRRHRGAEFGLAIAELRTLPADLRLGVALARVGLGAVD